MSAESEKRREWLEHRLAIRVSWGLSDVGVGLAYVMETQIKILEWIEKMETKQISPNTAQIRAKFE